MERAEKLVRLVTEGSISQLLLFAEEKITLYLSGKRCTLRTRLSDGSTLLHIAASAGRSEAFAPILKGGVDVNEVDHLGCTALHRAYEFGHLESVKILLQFGRLPCEMKSASLPPISSAIGSLQPTLSAVISESSGYLAGDSGNSHASTSSDAYPQSEYTSVQSARACQKVTFASDIATGK